MFNIAKALKEAREKAGVSIEEASKDLNIKALILENIEEGNIGCFKDIFALKDYLFNYAKYLGLDGDNLLDDFNKYMFEYTSKIPVKEIEKQVTEQYKEKQEEKIVSPYSNPTKKYSTKIYIIAIFIVFILVIVIMIWSIFEITSNKLHNSEMICTRGVL